MRALSFVFGLAFALSGMPAHAALVTVSSTLLSTSGPVSGNDKLPDVNAFLSDIGVPATGLLGKIESDLSAESKELSPISDYFKIVFGAIKTVGTIEFDMTGSGKTFDYFTLKAANKFAVYEVDNMPVMGKILFNTGDASLKNGNGKAQDISHISFFGVDALEAPLPAAVFLFPAGLGLFAGLKRLSARRRLAATA